MLNLIIGLFPDNETSKAKYSDHQKLADYALLVHLRDPRVNNVASFIDGCSIPVECCDDIESQNAAYYGYHHDTMCNNVFAAAIMHAAMNFSGRWHNSLVALDLINISIKKLGAYCMCGPCSAKVRRSLSPI